MEITNSWLLGIVSLLIAGLLAHRLSLSRDKRKEYNEAAKTLKEAITKAKKHVSVFISLEDGLEKVRPHVTKKTFTSLEESYAEYNRLFSEAPRDTPWDNLLPFDEKRKSAIRATLQDMDRLLKLK
ncbi:TPA: hypothetical protein ACPJ2P_000777 [Vibrio alginolyticus]